jgi:hypothetical protein
MNNTATAVAPVLTDVRLTIPSGWRQRPGGPFCNNMSAKLVGNDPKNGDRLIVKIDGAELPWPKEHVHST